MLRCTQRKLSVSLIILRIKGYPKTKVTLWIATACFCCDRQEATIRGRFPVESAGAPKFLVHWFEVLKETLEVTDTPYRNTHVVLLTWVSRVTLGIGARVRKNFTVIFLRKIVSNLTPGL